MKERLNVVKEYLAKINRRTKIIAAIAAAISCRCDCDYFDFKS